MLSKIKLRLLASPERLEIRKRELQKRLAEQKSKPQLNAELSVSFDSNHQGPLPPIVLPNPACPYCGVIQDPPPSRRRKCKDCAQIIHVKTDREERKKYLITAHEAERTAAIGTKLERERRNQEWKELSQQVQAAMQAGDWQSLRRAYQQQATILFHEGRPHFRVAQESARAQLIHLLQIGVDSVKVMTSKDERVCAHCRALDGEEFTIQEALDSLPIPGPNCTDGDDLNPHCGRCRCIYVAVYPGSRE